MKERLMHLIEMLLDEGVSDIHFIVQKQKVKANYRGIEGLKPIQSALIDYALFQYLKFISDLDLGNACSTQSGNFTLNIRDKELYFRFALISSYQLETGVLRILNNHKHLTLKQLIKNKKQLKSFYHWSKSRSGMILFCGPTGSGKTTTLHALLSEIAMHAKANIITLEDPIEIPEDRWLQLAINEKVGFTYEEGIKQLLRHDPDIIMLGEIRDSNTAKMAYRCALTGHMVFSTVHAKDAQEAIKRLYELGLQKEDILQTLKAVCAQRLFPYKNNRKEKVCIYEILEQKKLLEYLQTGSCKQHTTIYQHIAKAVQDQWIAQEDAQSDLSYEYL